MYGNHFARSLLLGMLILPLFSCLSPGPEPTSGTGIAVSKINTVDGSAYFKIETARYDKPEVKTIKATCQIFPGDPTSKTCTLIIPEEELFYSKFYMTFGVDAGASVACKVINFTPFAYLGSYSGAFVPPWAYNSSAVDCNRNDPGEKLSADCYNGAAKQILSSFPDKSFIHFFPDEGVEGKAAVSAPYEIGMRYDNTWVANNLTNRAVSINLANGNSVSDRYVGTVDAQRASDLIYQDWKISCMDEFYEPVYEITVIISDQDITAGDSPGDPVLDDFYDWVGL